MHPSSHSLDRLGVAFDDSHAVAHAGLILPATLARRLGLRELVESQLGLGSTPGHANVGDKAMTLVHSMLAGGDSIEDAELLRAGATQSVLGHGFLAPSTLRTYLRSFSFGHVRQLGAVSRGALARAWGAGAGPRGDPLTIDVDSTICETYGLVKQGAGFGYTKVRGYHPLLTIRAGTGEVLHSRLRGGRANTVRGAAGFLSEAFYSKKVLLACRRARVRFSVTVRQDKAVQRTIAAIPETAWLAFSTLTHNLARWVTGIGLWDQLPVRTTSERLRRRLFSVPGRRTRSGRAAVLHLPQDWPWAHLLVTALARLRAVTRPSAALPLAWFPQPQPTTPAFTPTAVIRMALRRLPGVPAIPTRRCRPPHGPRHQSLPEDASRPPSARSCGGFTLRQR